MAQIRKDDIVCVRTGVDKGKTGKVLRVFPDKQMVLVEGLNLKMKHLKPTEQNRRGGRIQKAAPIHWCKVQLVDPKTGKGTRVKLVTENGVKKRIAVKTGSDLGVVSK